MSKFLRTVQKIDGINQKVIMQVESCHHCPLMKFHIDHCLATCRVFENAQTNVVDDFVINYNITNGEIYDRIDIPKWCRLPDLKSQLDFDNKTYIIHEDKVLTSNAIIDNDLPLYKPSDIDGQIDLSKVEDEELGVMEMLPALVAASVFSPNTRIIDSMSDDLTADEAYEQAYSEYENYTGNGWNGNTYKPAKKNEFEICSLCGEEDETVSRNTNHGMCDSCWEVSFEDDKRKKKAFINNFRLKRGESFIMTDFNTSVLKTDSLKVIITV